MEESLCERLMFRMIFTQLMSENPARIITPPLSELYSLNQRSV